MTTVKNDLSYRCHISVFFFFFLIYLIGDKDRLPSGKESTCQGRGRKRCGFGSWVRKIPWRRAWQSLPVFLPRESHGQRSLVGYSPWGHKQSDMTEVTSHAHTEVVISSQYASFC